MKNTKRVRVEGRSKVTGKRIYVDDLRPEDTGFDFDIAVPVTSRCAVGKISAIDTSAATHVPGVKFIMTYQNAPKLKKVGPLISMVEVGGLLPLQDNRIHYFGQCVAVVVADNLLAAQEAARLVKVSYTDTQTPIVTLAQAQSRLRKVKRAGIALGKLTKGDAKREYEAAAVQLDETYHCAPHHHNAIEIGTAIANWDDDGGVTVYAATQWHHLESLGIAQAFGLGFNQQLFDFAIRMLVGRAKEGKVRLNNMMSGGAFGRNLNMIHVLLAAMAAKQHGKAVKIVLSRAQTYTMYAYRGEVNQRLRVGVDAQQHLSAIVQEPQVAIGAAGDFVEPVGEAPMQLYAHKSHFLQHRVARLDLKGTGWMRGPGISSAIFAVESAMDELAHKQGLDPLEFRRINHADVNPENGKPWASKSLLACYDQGATMIGWQTRPQGGSYDAQGQLIGYGMATSFDLGRQFPASARVTLNPDGTATVAVAAAEIGQGIMSALTTIAAESLGLPHKRITLQTQHTKLPYAAGSIGSTGTFSNGSAIYEAALAIKARLFKWLVKQKDVTFYKHDPSTLHIDNGEVVGGDGQRVPLETILAYYPKPLSHHAKTGRTFGMGSKFAKASFGAIFTGVAVDPLTMVMKVKRMVGAFACGRIIEPLPACNQILGGMVWGMGQALFEETRLDPNEGSWVNDSLAEALVSTNADTPEMDMVFVEEDDTVAHPLGMKGLAEVGLVGPAPAIANAFYDATGKRLRKLPLLLEDRLTTPSDRKDSLASAVAAEFARLPVPTPVEVV
ncbi:MAG: xanthine dehydrogenase family protein molybdopterin-binding subunit [Deinococcota bacterium]